MQAGFRASMNWMHTWAGVVLGGLLFAIFWMGTLSVFDREIDRWMIPETRLALPPTPSPLTNLQPSIDAAIGGGSPFWSVVLPTERQPVFRTLWREKGIPVQHDFHPVSGKELATTATLAGTGFVFPFHHMLHVKSWRLGTWLVGAAGMAVMVLAVSGVIIHRKIFTDFFTLRPEKQPRRFLLDLHNVAGALGFPFYFVISLTGLIFLYTTYFPASLSAAYQGDSRAFGREAFGSYSRPKAGMAGEAPSLDAVVEASQQLWGRGQSRPIVVHYPGDAAAYVQVARPGEDRISAVADIAYFDALTAELLHQRKVEAPMLRTQRFLSGLHQIQFRHWTLRWVYFGLGLLGCVTIATGYLFWLETRRKKHAQLGLRGVRLVEGLTIGSVTGIVAATFAFFVVNRLLPPGASLAGYDRASLEVSTFYLVWLASFAHAWLRPARSWSEQCVAIAALGLLATLLNGLTTGDHLVRSLGYPHLWPVAGMDLLLLGGAGIAAAAAVRLERKRPVEKN